MTAAPPAVNTSRRRSTFALLWGLYVSQFLGVGFFHIALTAILRERGVGLEQIGLLNVLGLLWAAKFLWAPFVDRFGNVERGHYRSWLLVLQPGMAVLLVVMIPFDVVADFGSVILLVAGIILLSATQDIAADALAVRMLAENDRGRGTGIQVAGGYLGNIVGGGGVLVVYDVLGWSAALLTLAGLTVLPTVMVLRYREVEKRSRTTMRASFGALVGVVVRRPGAARWAFVVMPLTYAACASANGLIAPALVDAGWSLTRIGLATNVFGGTVAISAALFTGVLLARFSIRPVLLGALALAVVATVGLAPLMMGMVDDVGTAISVAVYFAGYTAGTTVVYAVNMTWCRSGTAGTDFTVLSSVGSIFSFVLMGVVVAAAGTFGYPTMLAVCAALAVGALVAAVLLPLRPPPRGHVPADVAPERVLEPR